MASDVASMIQPLTSSDGTTERAIKTKKGDMYLDRVPFAAFGG